ncbi:hypothetical protein FNF29_00220 [Cafeteria roenbergensis]|uniref:GTP cyclohydrolase 1 n=1 Tax=Cafeteria roenbergensis TaxID=33653 RepID=A0A5A8CYQ2_CAFRO|nr:hypothetical protein FNF29_00220 [Cafeteria roenbergensis]|eukprot:KAA0157644.1 hypothetical protein FNF29_00220 [Cafeteria roenbergensis]
MSDEVARKTMERDSIAQVRAAGKELAATETALLTALAEPLTTDAKASIKSDLARAKAAHAAAVERRDSVAKAAKDSAVDETPEEFWHAMASLDAEVEELGTLVEGLKQVLHLPPEQGFRLRAGADGLYVGARDVTIAEMSAGVALDLLPAGDPGVPALAAGKDSESGATAAKPPARAGGGKQTPSKASSQQPSRRGSVDGMQGDVDQVYLQTAAERRARARWAAIRRAASRAAQGAARRATGKAVDGVRGEGPSGEQLSPGSVGLTPAEAFEAAEADATTGEGVPAAHATADPLPSDGRGCAALQLRGTRVTAAVHVDGFAFRSERTGVPNIGVDTLRLQVCFSFRAAMVFEPRAAAWRLLDSDGAFAFELHELTKTQSGIVGAPTWVLRMVVERMVPRAIKDALMSSVPRQLGTLLTLDAEQAANLFAAQATAKLTPPRLSSLAAARRYALLFFAPRGPSSLAIAAKLKAAVGAAEAAREGPARGPAAPLSAGPTLDELPKVVALRKELCRRWEAMAERQALLSFLPTQFRSMELEPARREAELRAGEDVMEAAQLDARQLMRAALRVAEQPCATRLQVGKLQVDASLEEVHAFAVSMRRTALFEEQAAVSVASSTTGTAAAAAAKASLTARLRSLELEEDAVELILARLPQLVRRVRTSASLRWRGGTALGEALLTARCSKVTSAPGVAVTLPLGPVVWAPPRYFMGVQGRQDGAADVFVAYAERGSLLDPAARAGFLAALREAEPLAMRPDVARGRLDVPLSAALKGVRVALSINTGALLAAAERSRAAAEPGAASLDHEALVLGMGAVPPARGGGSGPGADGPGDDDAGASLSGMPWGVSINGTLSPYARTIGLLLRDSMRLELSVQLALRAHGGVVRPGVFGDGDRPAHSADDGVESDSGGGPSAHASSRLEEGGPEAGPVSGAGGDHANSAAGTPKQGGARRGGMGHRSRRSCSASGRLPGTILASRSALQLVTAVAGAAAADPAASGVGNGAAKRDPRLAIPDDVLPGDVRRDRLGRMMDACRVLLEEIGEDVTRDGIAKTPLRMAKALLECTAGYAQDPREILESALFDVDAGGGMVVVKDIAFHSMCEHHVLPFAGKAHIAYLPGDRVVGLSKLARATDAIAKRLQVQERLTRQIAEAVRDAVGADDVAVITTAE